MHFVSCHVIHSGILGGDGSPSSTESFNSMTGVISTGAAIKQEGAEEAAAVAGREEEAAFHPVKDDEDPEADVPLRTIPLRLNAIGRLFNPTGPAFLFFFEFIVDGFPRVIGSERTM